MTCRSCGSTVPDGEDICPSCAEREALQAPTVAFPERDFPGGLRVDGDEDRPLPRSPHDASRFRPGDVLAGRYRMVSMLGRGSMGEVYRADDLKLGQPVALKFLPAGLELDATALACLLDEVKLARQVTHPNVCRVFDVGEWEGIPFLSMEYVDGEDLRSLRRRIGRLPQERAIEIARQLASGLAAAHRQGILHRDLKPENVMIDAAGRARLTDFGVAVLAASAPSGSGATGTPAYMAPEQPGEGATVASDLYALGLVLYELVTGQPAFPSASLAETLRLHREVRPTPPSRLVAGLDPVLERVILQCLAKNPRDRPASAQAVAAALPSAHLRAGTVLKTLLARELEGDVSPELAGRRQEEARALLERHGGREIAVGPAECPPGSLVLFERPGDGVDYALAYHQALARLSSESGAELSARVGIHLAEVHLPVDLTSGAERPQVAEEAAATVRRLTALACGGQTLLSRGAFDLARQGGVGAGAAESPVRWVAHGGYALPGVTERLEVFEVGREGSAPLRPPGESQAGRRVPGQDILGWRPGPGLRIPHRPHWVVEHKLGEGGFGEVWRAVHRKTGDRRVFKFCHDASRLRWLQREITLFRLLKEELGERDDIARIFDWNFEETPYFIESEYTEGGSLVAWAEDQGGLGAVPLGERLEIVAQIATALAAAHSVGVLHKDVKPGNVLITRDTAESAAAGKVRARLTDFGVGTLTELGRLAQAGITVAGLTVTAEDQGSPPTGTRLYMAPELVEGKAATLQADVYALGVMLYQIVVGDFSRVLAPGWEREVEDELLREDIAVAVDGSPERRLADALRLAERLRSLESRRRERDEKRRERDEARRAVAALARSRKRRLVVAGVMAVLMIFAGAMGLQSRRIAREAETARQVSEFLVDLFKVSDPELAQGDKITAREILDRGVERIHAELRDQPEIRARLMHTMGTVYGSLGLYQAALPLLETAVALRRQVHGTDHVEVADSLQALATLLWRKDDYAAAEPLCREALAMRRRLLGDEHPDVAVTLNELATVLTLRGDYATAEPLFRESLAIQRRLLGEDHTEVAGGMSRLAWLLGLKGDYAAAEPLLREALAMRRRLLGDEHPGVASDLNLLAWVHQSRGDYAAAEPLLREALAMRRRLLGDEHPSVVGNLANLGNLLWFMGDHAAAESLYREALAISRRLFGDEHPRTSTTMHDLAVLLVEKGDYEAGEKLLRQALSIHRRLLGEEDPSTATILGSLAWVLVEKGNYAAAEPLCREALSTSRRLLGDEHPTVADIMTNLAALLSVTHDAPSAEPLIRSALAIYRRSLPEGNWQIIAAESVLGAALTGLGRYAEAERLLLNAYPILKEQRGDVPCTRDTLRRLVTLYEAWGKPEKAAEYRALLP